LGPLASGDGSSEPPRSNHLTGCPDGLFDRQRRGVDHHGIGGRLQRGVQSAAVLGVPPVQVLRDGREVRGGGVRRSRTRSHPGGDPGVLLMTALRPFRRIRDQVDLQGRIGDDDGADVPALHHHPPRAGEFPLPLQQERPHRRVGRHRGDRESHGAAADLAGNIAVAEPVVLPAGVHRGDQVELRQQQGDRLVVGGIEAGVEHREGDDPVHRPGVQVAGGQRVRDPPRDRGLAGTGRAIDRDDERAAAGGSSAAGGSGLTTHKPTALYSWAISTGFSLRSVPGRW
jgi:hypothetical protein